MGPHYEKVVPSAPSGPAFEAPDAGFSSARVGIAGLPRDIIFASLVDWGRMPFWRWRAMFRTAARAGHRILWVDHYSVWGTWREVARNPLRMRTRMTEVDSGIHHLWSPLRVRGGSSSVDSLVGNLAAMQVRRAAARLGFDRPLLWIAGPPAQSLIGRVGESASMYDLSDDLALLGSPERLLSEERKAIRRSDLLWACSGPLRNARAADSKRAVAIPNGVDPEHFAATLHPGPIPAPMAAIPRPIVGYHGYIYDRIDWDLVQKVARAEPSWNLVFLGKVHQAAPDAVSSLSNVHFLGQIPYEDVPDYYRAFDVGWVPHRVTELTARQSSLKVLEYLAAGLPTVVTEITFADDLDPVVRLGRDHSEVISAIREELAGVKPGENEKRARAARHHSWEVRLAEIGVALQGARA